MSQSARAHPSGEPITRRLSSGNLCGAIVLSGVGCVGPAVVGPLVGPGIVEASVGPGVVGASVVVTYGA